MKRQELLDISARYPDWTLQKRGDFFGISRQAVHDMLKRIAQNEGKKPSLRMMSEIEAAYVGALIDTDGCVPQHVGRYWHITFYNNEIELVANILRLTGVGRVHYRASKGGWVWGVHRSEEVASLMKRLQPYSLKIQRALEKINAQTP